MVNSTSSCQSATLNFEQYFPITVLLILSLLYFLTGKLGKFVLSKMIALSRVFIRL